MKLNRNWRCLLLMGGIILWGAQPVQSASLFDQLVEKSRAEMSKKQGKLNVAMEWNKTEGVPVLQAFQKDFPFVKEVSYTRERNVENMQRVLMEAKQGRTPRYDIMHVSSESWTNYEEAGLFVKPPFDFKEMAKSLPADWGAIDARAFDPEGYFIGTTALARGNAWNPQSVPKGKEPTTWDACLDPMWKGKFLYDPRPKLTALWYDPKTREAHLKWLEGVKRNGVLNRGQTENLEKVIAGEFPLVCGVNYHSASELIEKGAPLKFVFPDPFPIDMGTQIHVVKWSKTPATTQLYVLWLASKGQPQVDKQGYRGFPWNEKSTKYALAKGKYVAVCDAKCTNKEDEYINLHATILNLPGVRKKK